MHLFICFPNDGLFMHKLPLMWQTFQLESATTTFSWTTNPNSSGSSSCLNKQTNKKSISANLAWWFLESPSYEPQQSIGPPGEESPSGSGGCHRATASESPTGLVVRASGDTQRWDKLQKTTLACQWRHSKTEKRSVSPLSPHGRYENSTNAFFLRSG